MNDPVYIARRPGIAFRVLDGEAVIMSAPDSHLFTLNDTATLLWQAADGVTPLDEIVSQKMCAEFEVTFEVALADSRALIENLASYGILIVSSAPIAAVSAAKAHS